MEIGIPKPSLRRLPLYYRCLKIALQNGKTVLSSADLGRFAGVPPEQVRKDLSYLSEQGKSRVGYNVKSLAAHLEEYLGLVNDKEAVLVGVGNLGRALSLFPGFANYGIRIVVLFDNDPEKFDTKVGDLVILPTEKLTNLVDRMKIRIGIITTPADGAQEIANAMVEGGIKAIWNFSTARIEVPEDVFVRNEDLASELALLSHYIKRLKIANGEL